MIRVQPELALPFDPDSICQLVDKDLFAVEIQLIASKLSWLAVSAQNLHALLFVCLRSQSQPGSSNGMNAGALLSLGRLSDAHIPVDFQVCNFGIGAHAFQLHNDFSAMELNLSVGIIGLCYRTIDWRSDLGIRTFRSFGKRIGLYVYGLSNVLPSNTSNGRDR